MKILQPPWSSHCPLVNTMAPPEPQPNCRLTAHLELRNSTNFWVCDLYYNHGQSARSLLLYDSCRFVDVGRPLSVCLFLTRGWACRLQLLLAFASAVILGFEFRGTRDLYFTVSDSKLPFWSPPTARNSYGGGIRPRLNTSQLTSQSQSHTVSQSWCRAQSGAYDQIFITVWPFRLLLLLGACSFPQELIYRAVA
jgi:hypothetical protein